MAESKIEGWIMYSDGVIDKDCSGAGMIYGVRYFAVAQIIDELIKYFGDYFSDEFPEDYELNGNGCISFELTNISFFEGQISFPESGQWDIAPHWEFYAKITKHEKWEDEI
jgi:hypothetical protein